LRLNGALPDAPIHQYFEQFRGRAIHVSATSVTTLLRAAARQFPKSNLDPARVSARALRPSGATALLTARVDPNLIQLLGRWQSDAMLRYLHVQSTPVALNLAQRMVHQGEFSLFPQVSPS
jgi:integrase